jgi:cytochrome c-type biogenesis protein CcmH/NrfF
VNRTLAPPDAAAVLGDLVLDAPDLLPAEVVLAVLPLLVVLFAVVLAKVGRGRGRILRGEAAVEEGSSKRG